MNIQINPAQSIFEGPNAQSKAGSSQALSDAFQKDLSSALESTLEKFGINPNSVTISLNSASSSGQSSQNIVVGSIAAALSSSATPASITSPAAPAASPSIAQAIATPLSFDDAYWTNQPKAVQSLRSINDPGKRMDQATKLMEQGYTIDVPIMAWGWDPQKVMDLRQSFGYTWVPSAGQTNIQEAPGVTVPGLLAYDPKNPPAHSIQVA